MGESKSGRQRFLSMSTWAGWERADMDGLNDGTTNSGPRPDWLGNLGFLRYYFCMERKWDLGSGKWETGNALRLKSNLTYFYRFVPHM